MYNVKDLEQIIYALTLQDRPTKRHLWLSKGFEIANRKPGFLLSYWNNRLSKGDAKDLVMYNQTLERFNMIKNQMKLNKEKALINHREKLIENWAKNSSQ